MKKYILLMLMTISLAAQSESYRVDLTIDPDFPEIRIASISVKAPAGFFLESFTSQITGEIEIRLSYGPKLPMEVEKGKTYTIKGHVNAEFGVVILNFAVLKCKSVKSPGKYHIGNFAGIKKKWPQLTMEQVFSKKERTFPDDWAGVYSGTLVRQTTNGIIGKVNMELHIQKTDDPNRWTWKIVYDGQARNYELIIIDRRRGIYTIDEKNSIMLSSFMINGTLYTHFGATFGYLLTTYRFEGNELLFNVTTSNATPYQTTGGQGQIPLVHSFEIREQQSARLTKSK
ncbi:hypothetical protein [Candidatus Uabimicrobium amorphum]|uniref:Uncharacterized protein n=1 Tax=Uabimicrobium amorphum TaxID=2596890 RepID=A0A5S9IKB2_UABAM|nr:hypothetical protein [Candidatus Uabimicrobium amorphum]BBM83443.1 hypothetical protein UABAM_01795 [Candidatus Uabimicrobium amorphum]